MLTGGRHLCQELRREQGRTPPAPHPLQFLELSPSRTPNIMETWQRASTYPLYTAPDTNREATSKSAGQMHKTLLEQPSQPLSFLCCLQEKGNFTSLSAETVGRQAMNMPSWFCSSSCSWPSFPHQQCPPTLAEKKSQCKPWLRLL